jgi:hypothetical protein
MRLSVEAPCKHCGKTRSWVEVDDKLYGVYACERVKGVLASGLCEPRSNVVSKVPFGE